MGGDHWDTVFSALLLQSSRTNVFCRRAEASFSGRHGADSVTAGPKAAPVALVLGVTQSPLWHSRKGRKSAQLHPDKEGGHLEFPSALCIFE